MPKRILEGLVVSDKGDKTVIVRVERTFLHPLLKKTVRRSKRYHAHDEANAYKPRRARPHHRVRAALEAEDLGSAAQSRRDRIGRGARS